MALADAAAATGPRMRAFLAAQQAHSAALLGTRAIALRHIREAEAEMDRAESSGKPFGYRHARVRHRATLAERQLRLGHLEAACRTWRTALDEWPMVQSGRADDRMRPMVELSKPHTATAHARSLYDQARATLPASMH
ncbi:hypothetical protein ACIG53_08900 [Streptomyces bauhiniae]|uniref:hypothetical protein n=1 Tax=Streptomyces bauhiniae TaxID=2340725 RepID=UPI0037D74870